MTKLEELINKPTGRRDFLVRLGSAGLGVAAGTLIAGCGGGGNNNAAVAQSPSNDQQILNAAATAEALAATMYYGIITSPIFSATSTNQGIGSNAADQAYLVAAYEEEISHYNALVGSGAVPDATTFYFPTGMFTNSTGTSGGLQTTIDTLTTLESAFIAAYLYGISAFTQTSDKVLAGQIMGVECEHRALARVVATDTGLTYTVDLSGSQQMVQPPQHTANNLAYEHTYGITSISQVVTALTPFLSGTASGFSTTAYPFSGAVTLSSSSSNATATAKTLMNGSTTISPVLLDTSAPFS